MKKTFRIAAAFALICAPTACLSDEEIEQRRKWAFDLAGDYAEQRADGTAPGSVVVANEQDKNDVEITFTRGALYDGEQAFVDLLAREEDKTLVATTLVFGDGDDRLIEGFVGGENVSTDFGKSSRVGVTSAIFEALPGVEGATDSEIVYTLQAAIENGSDELVGTLRVEFREQRPRATDADETDFHVEGADFDVVFQRAAGPIEADVCEDCYEDDGAPLDEEEPADESEA